ncbi:uncharacterized protein HMPREF1541_10695 [Cyphellophora europaea CBS 101466]|uniref:SMP-30/Gluconolactonase/LRE-like region domain-containing protein n=1 Tax=Cyphellophora europaea (strain CBS 101466) TaxID=1220924 RepID=W2S694_CYPE1|nr:uncharacterized protein HMPREF1541_10695 [Cyphellophora europaea CBS 101466]ETN44145.1 hypothetical protein HMPREF1541_10695 [Cyphellophora europaea CBS 101466]
MPSIPVLFAFTVANLAILWQWLLKDVVYVTYGVSRVMEPLSSFPYNCRRINDHNLAACEDAWLDTSSRQLFLACSNALARKAWNPAIGHFAAERRSRTDHIVALSIDTPHPQDPNAFDYRILGLGDFENSLGESSINMVGMSGMHQADGSLHLYLVNSAPTYNATTQRLAPQDVTGPNATIEVFALPSSSSSEELTHLHTFYNRELITTPNRPAPLPDGSLYISNDHGPNKAGLGFALSPVLRTGTIVHCQPPKEPNTEAVCNQVGGKHAYPNGLHYSTRDSLLYVPSSVTGRITVYEPQVELTNKNGSTLQRVADISVGYPIDNISEDEDGDLYAAVFPKLSEMMDLFKSSTPIDGRGAPTAAFKISRKGETGRNWEVQKVVEDPVGETLPATTTVVRDSKTGRLFFFGVVSPWIAVCELR